MEKMETGNWNCDEIGKGTFGIVTAWTNKVTHEKLVIKQCQHKLDQARCENWLKEITLMNNISHENIVKGLKIPEEIIEFMKNPCFEKDLLGLEFCDCDLRKVLSQPANCCGLKEKNVQNILGDVSCGMRFLHEDVNITHRDLKPENILLKHIGNETVYKISDLGCAKSIHAKSMCKTFVGTLEYLAPELYQYASGYTYTVDYWSFGTVIFECITGERPFIIDEPVGWFKCIKDKKDEEICGYLEENIGAKFSTELPSPNHLCAPVLSAFEEWLQIMLRQDRHERGKGCFSIVDNILRLKIIRIFDMLSCKEVVYESQRGLKCSNLNFFLENELNVPKDDQLLIFAASGNILGGQDLLVNEDLYEDTIYLFSKNKHARYSFNMDIPEKVCEIMTSPEELHSHAWLKKAYRHSVFYCRSVVYKYKCLLRGLRALMIYMKTMYRSLLCLKEKLDRASVKLETIIEQYGNIYDTDISYIKQREHTKCEAYQNEWDPMLKKIQSFSNLTDLNYYMDKIRSIQEKFFVLQKSKSVGIQRAGTELDMFADEAEKLYTTFRDTEKDTNKLYSGKGICGLARDCTSNSESLFNLLSEHMTFMIKSYDDICSLDTSMEKEISRNIETYQLTTKYQMHQQTSLLGKLIIKDSPMISMQSNLLPRLEAVFMEDDDDTSCVGFSQGVISDISDNLNKLKKLTKDELGSTETVANATFPITAPITTPIDTSLINRNQQVSSRSCRVANLLNFPPQLLSKERLPSPSGSFSLKYKFNERRKCDTSGVPQLGQGTNHMDFSPPMQQPEHYASSLRPVDKIHYVNPCETQMMHYNDSLCCTQNYATWRPLPVQELRPVGNNMHFIKPYETHMMKDNHSLPPKPPYHNACRVKPVQLCYVSHTDADFMWM